MKRSSRLAALCLLSLLSQLAPGCQLSEARPTEPPLRATQVLHPPSLSPEARLPLVIALHGLGDTPERFLTLFETSPLPARVVALEGFRPYHKGFSWFPIPPPGAEKESQLHRAIEGSARQLTETIVELTRHYPTRGLPIITGFSQGGMLAFYLALQHPHIISEALPIAGSFSSEALPGSNPPRSAPIIAFHGQADTRVPYETTHTNIVRLKERGGDVKLYTYPSLGHRMNQDELRDWRRELAAAVARTPP